MSPSATLIIAFTGDEETARATTGDQGPLVGGALGDAMSRRIFPGVSVQAVKETLQSLAGSGVSVTAPPAPIEAAASPLRADLMTAFAKAVHATQPGVPLIPHMELGYSDGAIFRANGIPGARHLRQAKRQLHARSR